MPTTPSVASALSDPNFQGLPPDQQKVVLGRLDPNFSSLPSDQQDKVLQHGRPIVAAPSPSWLDQAKQSFHDAVTPIQQSFDTNTQTSPKEPLLETGLKRVVGAVGSPFVHPQQFAQSFAPQSATEAIMGPAAIAGKQIINRGKEAVQDYQQGGLPYAATKLAGDVVGGMALGEAAGALPDAVGGVASKGADILTGGTKVASDLNKTVADSNAAADVKAQNANVAAQAKRMDDLNKHFDAIQKAKGNEPTTVGSIPDESGTTDASRPRNAKELQSHKEALERGVEQLDTKFQDDLKATAKDAKGQLDAKYDTVRKGLDAKIDPESGEVIPAPSIPSPDLANAVKDAESHLAGSTENIKQFRDILAKHPESDPDFVKYEGTQIPKGHPLYDIIKGGDTTLTGATFRDLQGYYSELGDKLSSGGLQGDVYQAMKSLHDSIGTMMQTMADENGVGKQLQDAQSYARDYYSTWRDPSQPLYKAIKAPERGQSIAQLQGKDVSGIQALARYNPELAKRANTIRAYQQQAKSISSTPFTEKPVSKLAPTPEPITAQTQTIGPEDIQAAKAAELSKRADAIRHYTNKAAGYITGYRSLVAIGRAMSGDTAALAGLPADLGEGVALAAGGHGIASLVESPKVAKFLTAPTPADVAQINPDIARGLEPIVQQARAKGIKISPALSAAISAHATKTNWYDQPK